MRPDHVERRLRRPGLLALLLPGAPRPDGLRGLVRDPGQPDLLDPQLVRDVPGLDAAALHRAVAARGLPVRVDR